ncbi:MAG: yajC [Friedmanniella sp.]|jgi:preprotein translocase subunit YajC|nr:yajC [Friedmanniella sp.]
MPQQFNTLILIVLMVVAFYFLIMRPQKKRQQALAKTMRELEPGTRVLLGSGVFGTVVSVGEKQAVVEIAPGVEMTVLKQAIVRRVTDTDEDGLGEDDSYDDELETTSDATTTDPAVTPAPEYPSQPQDNTGSEPRRTNL